MRAYIQVVGNWLMLSQQSHTRVCKEDVSISFPHDHANFSLLFFKLSILHHLVLYLADDSSFASAQR